MKFHLLVLSPACNPARVYPCTANIILIVYPIAGVHILGLYMGLLLHLPENPSLTLVLFQNTFPESKHQNS